MKCTQRSIYRGDWGGVVEDDPHTGDWKFLSEGVGVGFDPPPPVPIQQGQHNVQMISKYAVTMVKDRNSLPLR